MGFPGTVTPSAINVYFNLGTIQVTAVKGSMSATGPFTTFWTGAAQTNPCCAGLKWVPPLSNVIALQWVRIEFDNTNANSWTEIDAIGVVTGPTMQSINGVGNGYG